MTSLKHKVLKEATKGVSFSMIKINLKEYYFDPCNIPNIPAYYPTKAKFLKELNKIEKKFKKTQNNFVKM